MRRRLRRYRLRHKIHAIKTRPNNPLRFLQRKNSIHRYLANDLTCAARKTTFRTRKRFHNKQYTPKSKDQPFESDRTHFDIGFNNGSIAMHRPSIIFSSFSQNHNRSTKYTNRNNQSNQTIRKNNPHNTQSIIRSKHNKQTRQAISSINRKINHNKQSTQSLDKKHPKTNTTSNYDKMQCFLNIKISQPATDSEPTANTLFIKNSTQIHKTAGATTVLNKVQQPLKRIFYIFG